MENRILVLETIKGLRTAHNTASLNLEVDDGERGRREAKGARDTIFSCLSSSTVN